VRAERTELNVNKGGGDAKIPASFYWYARQVTYATFALLKCGGWKALDVPIDAPRAQPGH